MLQKVSPTVPAMTKGLIQRQQCIINMHYCLAENMYFNLLQILRYYTTAMKHCSFVSMQHVDTMCWWMLDVCHLLLCRCNMWMQHGCYVLMDAGLCHLLLCRCNMWMQHGCCVDGCYVLMDAGRLSRLERLSTNSIVNSSAADSFVTRDLVGWSSSTLIRWLSVLLMG